MQKILIVDDDPSIIRLYQRIFEMEGYVVDVATDGAMGLDRARVFRPDVILLDIMMSNVNGLVFLAKLKASPTARDIPVVVLSNVSDTRVVDEAKRKGADQYIVKSETEPAGMVSIVQEVLNNSGAAGAQFM